MTSCLTVRELSRLPYVPVWDAMKRYTDLRDETWADELWFVEHDPVFTQGQAGKAEHVLFPGEIPVVQVDRGGQVTYHGPGQQVVYFMLDLRRKGLGVRELVSKIEQSIVDVLAHYGIQGAPRADAPGVYVDGAKVCSLGLRIRRGCSFHGLAFNIGMDLEPFSRINPCGYAGLAMTQLSALGGPAELAAVKPVLIEHLMNNLGYNTALSAHGLPTMDEFPAADTGRAPA